MRYFISKTILQLRIAVPRKKRRLEFIKTNKDKKENILTMRVLKLDWQYLTAKAAVTKNVPNIHYRNRNCSTEYKRWFNEVYLNKRLKPFK